MLSLFHKLSFLYWIPHLFLIFSFLLILSHPTITFTYASHALITWFNTILPTLLPVLILSNLIIETKAWKLLIPFFHPIFKYLFSLSPSGSFALILSTLCGYPVGAKIISDLYRRNELSFQESKHLLTFCSFPSPMFLNGYVLEQCFHNYFSFKIPFHLSIYGSAILIGLFHTKFFYEKHHSLSCTHSSNESDRPTTLTFSIVPKTLLSSAEIILFVGLYMMLAMILSGFFKPFFPPIYMPLFTGILEMTTGISLLSSSSLSIENSFITAVFLCCFGGLSIILQTSAVLPKEKGWFSHYIIWKLIHGILASILLYVITLLI